MWFSDEKGEWEAGALAGAQRGLGLKLLLLGLSSWDPLAWFLGVVLPHSCGWTINLFFAMHAVLIWAVRVNAPHLVTGTQADVSAQHSMWAHRSDICICTDPLGSLCSQRAKKKKNVATFRLQFISLLLDLSIAIR